MDEAKLGAMLDDVAARLGVTLSLELKAQIVAQIQSEVRRLMGENG